MSALGSRSGHDTSVMRHEGTMQCFHLLSKQLPVDFMELLQSNKDPLCLSFMVFCQYSIFYARKFQGIYCCFAYYVIIL